MGRPALACLGVGLVALLLSLINQFSAAELSPPLVRASVLASLLAVGFLLVATLWTRAVPKAPERVALEGPQGLELDGSLPEALKLELAWGSQLLLTATPGATVLLHWRQRTLLRRGLLGSGTFLAVFLILFYPLTTDRIVGTDVFHAMILLCITGLAQIGVGNVDLWMVAALLLGSIPGVLVGSQLTKLAPNRLLRLCLAAVLFLSGLALLGKA